MGVGYNLAECEFIVLIHSSKLYQKYEDVGARCF